MCLGVHLIVLCRVSGHITHSHKSTVQICIVSIHYLHVCVYVGQNVLTKSDGETVQNVSLWVKTVLQTSSNNQSAGFLLFCNGHHFLCPLGKQKHLTSI